MGKKTKFKFADSSDLKSKTARQLFKIGDKVISNYASGYGTGVVKGFVKGYIDYIRVDFNDDVTMFHTSDIRKESKIRTKPLSTIPRLLSDLPDTKTVTTPAENSDAWVWEPVSRIDRLVCWLNRSKAWFRRFIGLE